MSSMRYVIISPVRNEAEYIRATVASVAAQTIRPARWVIVDDGSSDATPSLIDEAARQHDWITATHRQDRGRRLAGSGVMQAFFAGLARLDTSSWQFLVKLDGDVTFDSDYFERGFARVAAEPRLGIAGGLICNRVGGQVCAEAADDPAFHVRGATKIYRRECWEAIGGLQPATGWDTVDELKANMLGWVTRTFPEIKILHHRPAGAAYGTWSNWVKNGAANYFAGYHPLFMLAKCGRRFFQKPYAISAAGLALGYCRGYWGASPRVNDRDLIRYFRRQQFRRLLGQTSLWDVKLDGAGAVATSPDGTRRPAANYV